MKTAGKPTDCYGGFADSFGNYGQVCQKTGWR